MGGGAGEPSEEFNTQLFIPGQVKFNRGGRKVSNLLSNKDEVISNTLFVLRKFHSKWGIRKLKI